jgi:hypothetical protein
MKNNIIMNVLELFFRLLDGSEPKSVNRFVKLLILFICLLFWFFSFYDIHLSGSMEVKSNPEVELLSQ